MNKTILFGIYFPLTAAVLAFAMLVVLPLPATSQEAVSRIPDSKIEGLRNALSAANSAGHSHIAKRRSLKNLIREAQGMVDDAGDAQNRFAVLGILFQAQKRLLSIENNRKNMTLLFGTCEELIGAPNEYAEIRLEADLLLSEKRLSDNNATLAERVQDLTELLDRYRGTQAEARSLMIASMIIQKLASRDLERSIYEAMDRKFSGDLEVIEFRRQNLKATRIDVTFNGEFERLDGKRISFPSDVMGHMCLVLFWSKDEKTTVPLIEKLKKYEKQYPGRFDVFSFNVDELPDAGTSILREHGVDWTVMKLPDGRQHPAYRAYARGDAVALLISPYGKTVLKQETYLDAKGWRDLQTDVFGMASERILPERYLAQLQSLFIGDFLVWAEDVPSDGSGDNENHQCKSIKDCFVSAPFRFRLSREEALANYRKAEKLCAEVLKTDRAAKVLSYARDCRIIALLGIWNLTCEPDAFEQAVTEANAALEGPLGDGEDVVPGFCLAKAQLRDNPEEAEAVVRGFLADCGGTNAPPSALAAAVILALDAGARELHEEYRSRFLSSQSENPAYYAFTAFLKYPQYRFSLLQPNYSRKERWSRGYVLNFGSRGIPATNQALRVPLTDLDGEPLSMPSDDDKMTILLFLEPPAGSNENFTVVLDRHGRTNNNAGVRGMITYAELLADKHINDGIEVVAAFLSDDPERVKWLMAANSWTCQAALVKGGLQNPMVNRLGILSADRMPTVFLLRHDGTLAWRGGGIDYRGFAAPWTCQLAMKVHIEVSELEYGYSLLKEGRFKEAARVFAGPYLPWRPDRFGWRPVRYHARALALMGAGEWEAARVAIDKAIDAHKLRHFRGRRSKSIKEWQKDGATVEMARPCNVIACLWAGKAVILDKLGRGDDSEFFRKRSEEPIESEHGDLYADFHAQLRSWRLKNLK